MNGHKPTPAQLDVMKLAAYGNSVPEIAKYLGKAETTVKTQWSDAERRVGARNMVHAITIAFQHHWWEEDEAKEQRMEVFVPWAMFDADEQRLRCDRCGGTEPLPPLPMDLRQFCDVLHGFALRHAACVEVASVVG